MSKYTTTIYEILKNIVPNSNSLTPDALVEQGIPLFFDFNFPWYDSADASKVEFERMYLTTYLNNEIGQETLGAHKQYFKRVMCESMEEMQQKFLLLNNMPDIAGARKVKHDEVVNDTENTRTDAEQNNVSTDTTNQSQNTQSIHSDNPQVTFAQNDYASDMNRGEATANGTVNSSSNSSGTTDANRVGNTTRKRVEIETDTRDSEKYFKAIEEGVYLINTELLKRCRKLFMQLW